VAECGGGAVMTALRCTCRPRWANECCFCAAKRRLEIARGYRRVVAGGKCPLCGEVLMPNNSRAGSLWLQCLARRPDGETCGWQILCSTDAYGEISKEVR